MTAARFMGHEISNLTWVQGTFVLRFELEWYLTKTWRFSSSPGLPIFFSPLIFGKRDYYVQHPVGLTLDLRPRIITAFHLALI